MKKLILTTAAILFFLNIFAQEEKPCLFIATSSVKNNICSDYKWIQEGVNDRQEYDQKKKQFTEENKENSYTGTGGDFVSATECAIVYEFNTKRSGFNCSPKVYGFKKGPTIEYCEEQMNAYYAKNPKQYASPPNIVFRWSGKGLVTPQKQIVTADYGGVSGKFTLVKKASGGEFFVAQLTNTTKDKLATVLIVTDTGDLIEEELAPGSILTKKYDIKKVEIQVLYRKANEPKPSFDIIQLMKESAHDILEIINGELIQRKWDPTCMCIRG